MMLSAFYPAWSDTCSSSSVSPGSFVNDTCLSSKGGIYTYRYQINSDAASVQRKAGQRGGRVRTAPSPKTATIRAFDYTQFTSVPRAAHSSYINHFGYENSAREANSGIL